MKKSQFEKEAKTAFDQQVDSLNSDTRHRLRLAREQALSKKCGSWLSVKWLTGAGAGLAFAAVMTFMLMPNLTQNNNLSPLEDLEMLNTDTELYTQMDFYQWLDESALSDVTL